MKEFNQWCFLGWMAVVHCGCFISKVITAASWHASAGWMWLCGASKGAF
jgi:hypothetical protein